MRAEYLQRVTRWAARGALGVVTAYAVACGPEVTQAPVVPAGRNVPAGAPSADSLTRVAPATGGAVPPTSASAPRPAAATTNAGPAPAAVVTPPRTAASYPAPKPIVLPLAEGEADPFASALLAADLLIDDGKLAQARTALAELARKSPRALGPKLGLLRARAAAVNPSFEYGASKGNRVLEGVRQALQALVQSAPDYLAAQVDLGRLHLQLGDAEAAVTALTRAVTAFPREAEVHSALAVAQLASGRVGEAIAPAARAVELDAGTAARHGNLATILFLAGRVREAIDEYRVQALLSDTLARSHSDLGTALLADQQLDAAIAELRRAVALDASRAGFHSNLGYALQLKGDRPQALAEYERAIALDSKLASGWLNLGVLLSADPTTRARARTCLETARKLDPEDPRAIANLEELAALEKAAPGAPPARP